jgi:FMN reductase
MTSSPINTIDRYDRTDLVAVNASISPAGRTHQLAEAAVRLAGGGRVIDLALLDAGALLGRNLDHELDEAIALASSARRLVLATPVYRTTFTSLLKAFVERLPKDALEHTAVVLAASGSGPRHFLSLDTGVRSLVASVKGWTVPTVAYGGADQFTEDGEPLPEVLGPLALALDEAERLARSFSEAPLTA